LVYRKADVHELSLCQALLQEVATIATRHRATAVERISVEVGRLSGVEPELLLRAFEVARVGSCSARAVLSLTVLEITVRCADCGATSRAQPNCLLCAACGSFRTRVLEGDELRLRAVELDVLDVPEARAVPAA
jgi:hydrogenase nickel incorporation protein HypA/HybF